MGEEGKRRVGERRRDTFGNYIYIHTHTHTVYILYIYRAIYGTQLKTANTLLAHVSDANVF